MLDINNRNRLKYKSRKSDYSWILVVKEKIHSPKLIMGVVREDIQSRECKLEEIHSWEICGPKYRPTNWGR